MHSHEFQKVLNLTHNILNAERCTDFYIKEHHWLHKINKYGKLKSLIKCLYQDILLMLLSFLLQNLSVQKDFWINVNLNTACFLSVLFIFCIKIEICVRLCKA